MIFLMGIGAFFLTFHLVFLGASVLSRWGVELLSNETMGKRLCILSEISWGFLLFLFAKRAIYWIISDFERGIMIATLNTLGLSLFHHTGLAQADLLWMIGGIVLSWIKLENYKTVRPSPSPSSSLSVQGPLIFIWITSMLFSLFTMTIQVS
jgi:uncharacterized protein with PQ loop repeat